MPKTSTNMTYKNAYNFMCSLMRDADSYDSTNLLDSAGEVNMTTLAECCAEHFGCDYEGGPLDDPDHFIWDAALEVAEGARP